LADVRGWTRNFERAIELSLSAGGASAPRAGPPHL
jgi:hypothetical protein